MSDTVSTTSLSSLMQTVGFNMYQWQYLFRSALMRMRAESLNKNIEFKVLLQFSEDNKSVLIFEKDLAAVVAPEQAKIDGMINSIKVEFYDVYNKNLLNTKVGEKRSRSGSDLDKLEKDVLKKNPKKEEFKDENDETVQKGKLNRDAPARSELIDTSSRMSEVGFVDYIIGKLDVMGIKEFSQIILDESSLKAVDLIEKIND